MPRGRIEIITVFLGRVGLAVFSLLLLTLLLSVFDAAQYGLYTLIFATASWLNLLLFGAVHVPLTKYASNASNREKSDVAFITIAATALFSAAFITFFMSMTVYSFLPTIQSQDITFAAVITALFATAVGTVTMVGSYALGQRRQLLNVLVNNGIFVTRILAIVFALVVGISSTFGIMLSMALFNFFLAAVGIRLVNRGAKLVKLRIAVEDFRENSVLNSYVRNWTVGFGANTLLFGDKVLLGLVLPIEQIGLLAIYQQICRVLSNLTIGTFYQVSSPYLLKVVDHFSTFSTVIKSLMISILTYLPAIMVAIWTIPLLNTVLLQNTFSISPTPLLLVGLTVAINQTSKTNELIFYKLDEISKLNLPLFLALGVFATVGLFLARVYGLDGAIMGLLLASCTRYFVSILLLLKLDTAQKA